MPKVVFTHAVVDVDRWLKGKADRVAALGSNVVDYVAEDGSNNIAISVDVDDLAAMQAMFWHRRLPRSKRRWTNTVSSLPSRPT
jgi:hypothetical protein